MRKHLVRLLTAVGASLAFAAFSSAQDGGTGSIAGRVFNPATQEYVRNAQVTLEGANRTVVTEQGGNFRFENVPAGEARVTVSYIGYQPASTTVQVTPGAVVRPEIEIISVDARTDDNTVLLSEFVVSSEREGNAKAIMNQRNSMNVSRSVASDVFGDVTEGNVGEFLKFLPGVELEYVEADTRGPRLGGMDPEYAGVSIDGMKLASADAFIQYGSTENGSTGSGTRSFGFEQVSINSIESIEINRVASADMDADAPAGTINLRTKRAFDTKGRRIGWNVSTILNSEEFHLKESTGANDQKHWKFKPNYSFNYSDQFLENRLGILIGVSESNLYSEQYRIDHTLNTSPEANDPRPYVITALAFKDGPKWTKRFTTTFTTDFKATPDLILSLSTTFNGYDGRFYNRTLTFNAANNNNNATSGRRHAAGDGVTTFGTATAPAAQRTVGIGGGSGSKLTNSLTIVPRFEYTRGSWKFDGATAFSRSKNDYDNLARENASNANVNAIQGIGFTATRDDPKEAAWKIQQTAGPDWAEGGNYTNPRMGDDGRFGRNEVFTGELNARVILPIETPTFIKFGAKVQERSYEYDQKSPLLTWSFVGPGGNILNPNGTVTTIPTSSYAGYISRFQYDMGQTGGEFTSISGSSRIPFADRDLLGELFRTNPEWFVSAATAANYASAQYLNHREYDETVTSAYVMGNSRIGRWQFQGGLRFEDTETESQEFNPLTNSDVWAAGFDVATIDPDGTNGPLPPQRIGNPTTIPGMIYKYETNPRVVRKGGYDNYFPSVTAKYRITENFIADVGFGKTIKRPVLNALNGVWEIDEVNLEIRAPNAGLKPELSDKFVGALSYYFQSAGNVTLTVSQTSIKNLRRETDYTADEFAGVIGEEIPSDFSNWTFITSTSDGPKVDFRALELSYTQPLTFLPDMLRGTNVFASYTRSYASERRGGITPHTVSGGIDWRWKRVQLGLKGVWQDEADWTNTVGRFRRQNTKLDFGGAVKITNRVSFYFSGRNVLETPHRIFNNVNGVRVLTRLENYGSNWSFGLRGTF